MTHAHRNPHATTRSDRMRHIARILAPTTTAFSRGNWRARMSEHHEDFPFLEARLDTDAANAPGEPGAQDLAFDGLTDHSTRGND